MKLTNKWLINFVLISSLFVSVNGFAAIDYPENPGVDDTAIYISNAGISRINIETLEIKWSVLTRKQTSEPVVTGRHVVVGSNTGIYVLDKLSYVLDKLSSSKIWSIQTNNTLFSPLVGNNAAFVGSKIDLFQAIDIENTQNIENTQTGQGLWSTKFEEWVYPPALVGETLTIGDNRPYLTALHKTTGKILWKRWISQELVYRPADIDRKRVVISKYRSETQLISSKNGDVIWTFRNKVLNFSPVLLMDEIVFETLDGRLQSVNIGNGKLLWEHKKGGHLSIQTYPELGTVMISNNQGKIVKIDANDGLIKWRKQVSSKMVGAPLLLKEDVVVFHSKRFTAR